MCQFLVPIMKRKEERMSRKSEIEQFVNKKIYALEQMAGESAANAMYANLRRSVGKAPGEEPSVFGIILRDMPEEFLSRNGEATKEEWACHIALTLYALHQQGNNPQNHPVNSTDNKLSMGASMQNLVIREADQNAEQRMQQRLQMLATAKDIVAISYHLRGIIKLFRANGIVCNYAKLAGDLYEMQFRDQKTKVCLRWGQDFYRSNNNSNKDKEESK